MPRGRTGLMYLILVNLRRLENFILLRLSIKRHTVRPRQYISPLACDHPQKTAMPIPTFIINAKLTCDLDADTATLRRERDMLTACAQQQAEAHRMLQAAQASLASVSGMPNRREIVAAAAERYLACNNALSATLACEERTVRRIAEIEECMRHAEYRATVEQRKVDADSRAVLERMPVDLRRLVGKQVYSVGVGPLAFAVGDVVVCEHSACSKRSHAGDLFIIVCVVSADEDTAMVVYDVDEGSGAPSTAHVGRHLLRPMV